MNAVSGRYKLILLLVLTAMVMTGMLYFGIRLNGFRPANQARWLPSGDGLYFSRFGIAFTDSFFAQGAAEPSGRGLAIEMAIQPELSKYPDFRFILVVHAGDDARQLLIGQWRTSLIIMNGNDYSGKRGVARTGVDLGGGPPGPRLVTVNSDAGGTRVYLDGRLIKTNPSLHLYYPDKRGGARLVVGNSVTARHPWNGSIFGLALYANPLTEEQIGAHYESWRDEHSLRAARAHAPRMLYLFDEGTGERVANQAGSAFDLKVPAWVTILEKRFLELPGQDFNRSNMVNDMVINLFGFIPLGLILCALAAQVGGTLNRYGRQLAVLAAFLFSLSLEMAQVWIPSRTSSMIDLLLNTMGAGIGTLLYTMYQRSLSSPD